VSLRVQEFVPAHDIRPFITLTAVWSKGGAEASYKVSLTNLLPSRRLLALQDRDLRSGNEDLITRAPVAARCRVEGIRVKEYKATRGCGALRRPSHLEGPTHDFLEELGSYASSRRPLPCSAPLHQIPRPANRGLYGGNLAQAYPSFFLRQSRELVRPRARCNGLVGLVKRLKPVRHLNSAFAVGSTTRSVLKFTDRYMREGRNVLSIRRK